MMEKILTQSQTYTPQVVEHEGREHLVCPVVMLVEGVHHGSHGPILHTVDEMARFIDTWNGIPVTIGHPQEGETYVSANSPSQAEKAVGRVYNARMEDGKLKADVYVDVQRIAALHPEALSYLQTARPLDVSVGIFSTELAREGTWNQEQYTAVATDYRPDHLALLPDDRGACSWEDGCGIRLNKDMKTVCEQLQKLNRNGFSLQLMKGFVEIMDKVYEAVARMDTDDRTHFVEEVYDDHLVWQRRNRLTGETKLYRQSYTMEDDTITLQGDPEQVRREVSYTALQRAEATSEGSKDNPIINEKSEKMDEKLLAKVEKVISLTGFAESDREWLGEQSPETLDKMLPTTQEPPQVNKEQALEVLGVQTLDDVLAFATPQERDKLTTALALYDAKRAESVKSIMKGSDQWNEEELTAMSDTMLDKLERSIKPRVDYSANAEPQTRKEEPLLPPGVK